MQSIYLLLTTEDVPYASKLKPILSGRAQVTISTVNPTTYYEVVLKAKAAKCTQVATTSSTLLNLLVGSSSIDDYAGSIIERAGVEFLILNPLKQLITVNYGEFLVERYFSKFLTPEKFIPLPKFRWTLFDPRHFDEFLARAVSASFIAVDIETIRGDEDRAIDCIGFTFVNLTKEEKLYAKGSISLYTVVVPFEYGVNLAFIRKLLTSPAPKVFQNGKYDNLYLLRFGSPVVNYAFDTINLFHSWYSELPKDLGFITSFLLRKWEYWKDEGKSWDKMEHYGYNAKDCYTTAMSFIALMAELPEYAIENFKMEFPLVFPCLLAEATGLRRDAVFMDAEEERFNAKLEVTKASLGRMVAEPTFNPSSPPQTLKVFDMLGSGDVTDTTPKSKDKVKNRHPLNLRIVNAIESFRTDRKLAGTYLRDVHPKTGERKSWHGRIFFALNPHATDTGRLASKESAFWCGWQIQNIPRDRDDIQIKRGILPDPGFVFGECDRSQAEARDTAYLSGDVNLINAVDDETKDFHGTNASRFFGIPYERIVKSSQGSDSGLWIHKTVDKAIRDLAKRVNHGSNYNMGAQVMLDTMGIKNVVRAKLLLNLPAHWSLLEVTKYLLRKYAESYPVVKGAWYDKVKADIAATGKLVGPTGWTRYCFGNPSTNKSDLNAYVAHPPQSLSAMELNTAYMRVFIEIALVEPKNFKLGPQIHDSILFQYRPGREDLASKVQDCMDNPIPVTDTFENVRILRIPTDLKGDGKTWADVKPLLR